MIEFDLTHQLKEKKPEQITEIWECLNEKKRAAYMSVHERQQKHCHYL